MKNGAKKRSLKQMIAGLAREGMSQQKMAICIAMGVCIGIFPVLGTTTIICAMAAFFLRLNLPLIQLVNYAVYPLQIVLLVPFYVAGSWMFGGRWPTETGQNLLDALQNDLWASMSQVWDLTLYAIFIWLLVAPAVALLLYGLLKPLLGKILTAYRKARFEPDLSKLPN